MSKLTLTRAEFLAGLAASAALALTHDAWAEDRWQQQLPRSLDTSSWQLGPFSRAAAAPIIRPDAKAVFDGPIRGRPVHWMSAHTFNPASIVRDVSRECWSTFRAMKTVRPSPRRPRSSSARYPAMTPSSSSALVRRRHEEGERRTVSARSTLAVRPCCWRRSRMARSMRS